jgi:uncharacterized NAD(P)/FAD-binding protein YdhS
VTNRVFDVVVAGGGLAGSRVVVELLEYLRAEGHLALRAPEILMIDRRGAFGGGMPYGAAEDRGLLRIDTVGQSTPKDFQEWMFSHRYALAERCKRPRQDLLLRAWIARNERRLLGGAFDDLYVPRKFFAEFAASRLYEQSQRASEGGYARVEFLRGDIVGLSPLEGAGYEALLARGRRLCAATLVRAGRGVPFTSPAPDCYVLGTSVESIRTVYTAARKVAEALYVRLSGRLHEMPDSPRAVPPPTSLFPI